MIRKSCIIAVAFVGAACAGSAWAQADQFDLPAPPPPSPEGAVGTLKFIAAEAMIPGKVVKGAPYTATAVTETVQTLADGNRITETISSSLARDSEGRTRREQSLPSIGPWASEGPASKMVTINDPVSGSSYQLDDRAKTARKLGSAWAFVGTTENVRYERTVRVEGGPAPQSGGQVVMIHKTGMAGTRAEPGAEPKQEKLGQTTIEGVMADGVRTTTVVPSGAIGNERPITVTDERWYSPELQTTVLSKHSDPRMGETTFRLTNISRSEPAAALFQVPSDYQIVEAGKEPVEIKIEKR